MLLSHQAGLCGFSDVSTVEDFYDVERAAARLADATPFWPPGAQSGYHAITMGALASALLKRAEGRTIRQFVREELHQGLGLDIFIGLPESESARVSDLKAPTEMRSVDNAQEHTPAQIAALANPPLEPTIANEPDWRSAEIPSANGHATARSLAKLYSALASNGEINVVRWRGRQRSQSYQRADGRHRCGLVHRSKMGMWFSAQHKRIVWT